ncbi:hypothetical protein L3X38_005647 [Prunus dulcis]|uniref:Uncharacterized protein n=1 Tax=Prunus dulcis TaxID=3755 RepID=A0AAD4ZRB3_PRUDU|nr:hypothetical protein L3X38_005647 [Prunus dulcis]
MVCSTDTDTYQKKLDRLRVHFFPGLDPEFDQVRSEILRKEPKLDLDQSLLMFAVMHNNAPILLVLPPSLDATVMVAQRSKGPTFISWEFLDPRG